MAAFPFLSRRATERAAPAARDQVPAIARPAPAPEARGEAVRSSDGPGLLRLFGINPADAAGQAVTIEAALAVPAVAAAVGFLSRTLASLPVAVYEKTETGREKRAGDPVAALLNEAATDEVSAVEARRLFWQDVFTAGRGLAFIDRNARGEILNLFPLEVDRVTVSRKAGRKLYHYRDGARTLTYEARDVLDLAWMPAGDGLSARSPIYGNAGVIGLALAIGKYGRKFFANGGIPPFTVTGPMKSAAGAERASQDLTRAVREAAETGAQAIGLPDGHTLSPLGIDPEKMQMIAAQRFVIEEIARIYGLPPVFLQDLTHGTFSNTEQQDLFFVKHCLGQWVGLWEGEINLKLYGRGPRPVYAEASLAGILRGDLKSRAEGLAQQISTGQLTPNEARRLDNRPDLEGGEVLFMQGAMAPVARLAADPAPVAPAPAPAAPVSPANEADE